MNEAQARYDGAAEPEFDEYEVEIDFGAPVTALVTVAAGEVHVDGLVHGGLCLDADDLSDSALQQIERAARHALGMECV